MENASSSSNQKKGVKRKIPMEFIENENYRQVCFSKRRQGLFKKAEELNVLCGANVRIMAFSPAGKPYFYISPCRSSSTLDHFFPSSRQTEGDASELPNSISDLGRQASELRTQLEASKRRNESLKAICKVTEESVWRADLANADLARLEKLKNDLEQIKVSSLSQVHASSNKLICGCTSKVPNMGVGTGTVISHPAAYPANVSENGILGLSCSQL